MEIVLKRNRINSLYVEGEIYIGGKLQTFTVESTERLLKAGRYRVTVVLKSERKRDLCVCPCGQDRINKAPVAKIDIGHSWKCARRYKAILIGQPLIPGVIYNSMDDWIRINERIKKCKARKENVYLVIVDDKVVKNMPIKHWIK